MGQILPFPKQRAKSHSDAASDGAAALPPLPPMAELVLELFDFRYHHQNSTAALALRQGW